MTNRWTLDKPTVSLSTSYMLFCFGWQSFLICYSRFGSTTWRVVEDAVCFAMQLLFRLDGLV